MLRPLQPLARLEGRQLEHAVDQPLQALRLAADVREEAPPVLEGHLLVQQLGRGADRRERRLDLVREAAHVALDVALAFERVAHGLEGATERGHLRRPELRRGRPAPGRDLARRSARAAAAGIVIQVASARLTSAAARIGGGRGARDPALRALDEGLDAQDGLADRDDADQPTARADRRRDVVDGRERVGGVGARGAGAVLAPQRARHVLPAREVLPLRLAGGVVEHDALRVGHVHAQRHRLLRVLVDPAPRAGARAPRAPSRGNRRGTSACSPASRSRKAASRFAVSTSVSSVAWSGCGRMSRSVERVSASTKAGRERDEREEGPELEAHHCSRSA